MKKSVVTIMVCGCLLYSAPAFATVGRGTFITPRRKSVSTSSGYGVKTKGREDYNRSYGVRASSGNLYAYRRDFGKSNLRKWSSTRGMNTPWSVNSTTDTIHFKSSTMAFLNHLNNKARAAGVYFVITGGAERGYHAPGTYSHGNGYKVDISDVGIYRGSKAHSVLYSALAPFNHKIVHEWASNHFDITIYPRNFRR